ncbi:hypothetical protein [uncultured Ruegeria sp.]|uniref:hypothetical protein n=1 Tax=uncultured Ruegeria sp. TaxID=259304 RepID=UPI0026164687|nr:hypothetical protein [uncultured Ruegeria sp.]
MKLNEWAEANGLSDRQVADLMTGAIQRDDPEAKPVSVPVVQRYRTTDMIPSKIRMQAIYKITDGWVTANDFFDLETVG